MKEGLVKDVEEIRARKSAKQKNKKEKKEGLMKRTIFFSFFVLYWILFLKHFAFFFLKFIFISFTKYYLLKLN